jgi:hypothetical protein
MKPLLSALAAVLLSSCGCSKSTALESARPGGTAAPGAQLALAIPEVVALPDPAPADAEVPAPSAEEVAAFHASVPK